MRLVHHRPRLWHKHGAVKQQRQPRPRPPLDAERLERLALHYVGRYATTRAKLLAYLHRKIAERGWAEPDGPAPDRLVERLAALGYIDDAAFALARSASLQRRGYGRRRVGVALKAAGIRTEDAAAALGEAETGAWAAALRFAEKKRIGPFGAERPDRAARERQFAALMRAGHRPDHARLILAAAPGTIPEPDTA
jgi:regulatory protein